MQLIDRPRQGPLLALTLVLLGGGAATRAHATTDAAVPNDATSVAHHRHHRRHTTAAGDPIVTRMTADNPGLQSSSALVMDEKSSAVLYARHADVAMPIASITKLMTALVVLDAAQPLDEMIQITNEDVAVGKGAVSRLAVGTSLSRGDLIHLALMSSENRAAHALGRNYPGGLDTFVTAMNAKARTLGMSTAHFIEPTGLSSENVASPEDLSKLVIAASLSPTIQEYSTDPNYIVPVGRRYLEFHNTDALVVNPSWNIVVQKTGYISGRDRAA
jgi:D-alanyl-D-alanine endopeptidase (penicillin-binding protein 7)